jgi:hypothetical protein
MNTLVTALEPDPKGRVMKCLKIIDERIRMYVYRYIMVIPGYGLIKNSPES